jgi:RHS repeat-associated protein
MDFNGSGSLTMRYLWGPTGIVARQTSGSTVSWYLADHLGPVRDLINNSGAGIDHVDFSAFGAVLGETSPTNGDRFVAVAMLERDTITGLNLAVERDENPGTGRWDSQDPWGYYGNDANLSRYALNDPINAVDSIGLQPQTANSGPEPDRKGGNVRYGILGDIILALGGSPSGLKNDIKTRKGKTLPVRRNRLPHTGVQQGNYMVFSKVPPGSIVGTKGAGPCIGVIIRYPTGETMVHHFQGGNQPARTMYNTRPFAPPPGSTGLVFGGNGDPASNFLLGSVTGDLDSNKVDWGYSNTTGGNVDGNGNFILYPNEGMKPE